PRYRTLFWGGLGGCLAAITKARQSVVQRFVLVAVITAGQHARGHLRCGREQGSPRANAVRGSAYGPSERECSVDVGSAAEPPPSKFGPIGGAYRWKRARPMAGSRARVEPASTPAG